MRLVCVLVITGVAGAMAAPRKSPDSFGGYAGLKLRAHPSKTKGFAKAWKTTDTDNTSIRYAAKKRGAPAFLGVKVDDVVLTVSKHLEFVVGMTLKLSGDRCAAIEKALGTAWGEAKNIGGMNRQLEWSGTRVGAKMEHQGTDCLVFVRDTAWDDVKDELDKR